MSWSVEYTKKAEEDFLKLDGSLKKLAAKAIKKVQTNPLPINEGGYGKPLGNKSGTNLTGLLKIKLKSSGIRVVYKLIRDNNIMRIIVIGIREDDEVYKIATERLKDYGK